MPKSKALSAAQHEALFLVQYGNDLDVSEVAVSQLRKEFEKFEKLSNSQVSESNDNADVGEPQISELSLGSESEESKEAHADPSHTGAQARRLSQPSRGENMLLDSGEERRTDLELS